MSMALLLGKINERSEFITNAIWLYMSINMYSMTCLPSSNYE